MSRPQVTINRLTPRRLNLEPRESMNCKSCRKRKIKCNRTKPSCEACRVFQCACVYDAVPKKRGPKTDVLEALLKRVDGLEKRLQCESIITATTTTINSKGPISPTSPTFPARERQGEDGFLRRDGIISTHGQQQQQLQNNNGYGYGYGYHPFSTPSIMQQQQNPILSDSVLNTYFARLHNKPFVILDEAATRQSYRLGQLPACLCMAVYAATLRYTSAGTSNQSRMGLEYALQARRMVDIDHPSIEGLQTLLLLSQTFFAYGLGKKAYMTFSNCAAMVIALDLYREVPSKVNLSSSERELRRRLFWTTYIMDRFVTSGSKRPCLISDHSIILRLPGSSSSHASNPSGLGVVGDGELFNVGANIQYPSSSDYSRRKGSQGGMPPATTAAASTLLIDITRILGITNRYLAAGGVKGDSHFPWHTLSNLSKIRQELDIWAAGTQDVFSSIDSLFGHPESTTLVLSKLIYHLIHCLLYRPFLPIDLVELRGTGQHQSWQIEATNLCFSHSNAIAELVELGRNSQSIEWPDFVSFCVYISGTVHVHGVHYSSHSNNKPREGNSEAETGEIFSSSPEFLTREMNQLSWLREYWTGVQHQREMLQTVHTCHSELVRTVKNSPVRFSRVFHLEDFLDRYPGLIMGVEGGHVRLVDGGDFGYSGFGDRHGNGHDDPLFFNRPSIYPSAGMHLQQEGHFYHHQHPDRRLSKDTVPAVSIPPSPSPSLTTFRHNHSNSQHQLPSIFPHPRTDTTIMNMVNTMNTNIMNSGLELQQQQAQENLFARPMMTFSSSSPALLSGQSQSQSQSTFTGGSIAGHFPNENANSTPNRNPNPQYATFPFDTMTNTTSSSTGNVNVNGNPNENGNGNNANGPIDLHPTSTSISTPTSTSQPQTQPTNILSPDDNNNNNSTEKDPFLALLEQLAENEQNSNSNSQGGGCGRDELDFFLGGEGGECD